MSLSFTSCVAILLIHLALPSHANTSRYESLDAPFASVSVSTAMQNWAQSWSKKDLQSYFSSYVSGYKGDKTNPNTWKQARTTAISSKKAIGLDFGELEITTLAANKVQISFKQLYVTDSFKEISDKTMIWVRQGNTWLIERESSQ